MENLFCNTQATATGFIEKFVIDLDGAQFAPGLYFVAGRCRRCKTIFQAIETITDINKNPVPL